MAYLGFFKQRLRNQLPPSETAVPFVLRVGASHDHLAVAQPDKSCILLTPEGSTEGYQIKKSFPGVPRCATHVSDQVYCFGLQNNRIVMVDLSVPEMPAMRGNYLVT